MTSQSDDILELFALLFQDGQLGSDIGSKLTCTEAEVFAWTIAAGGQFESAVGLLSAHARSDEDPHEIFDTSDKHYPGMTQVRLAAIVAGGSK